MTVSSHHVCIASLLLFRNNHRAASGIHRPHRKAGLSESERRRGDDDHTENDTIDRMNVEKFTNIVRLIYRSAWEAANQGKRIPFVRD